MRYIIIALLLAGAAWGQEVTDWEITTFGTTDDGFLVVYTRDWYHVIEGPTTLEIDGWQALIIPEGETYNYVIKTEHYDFLVDSLTDIRPTPAEMEEK